jgi:hypothetical protein
MHPATQQILLGLASQLVGGMNSVLTLVGLNTSLPSPSKLPPPASPPTGLITPPPSPPPPPPPPSPPPPKSIIPAGGIKILHGGPKQDPDKKGVQLACLVAGQEGEQQVTAPFPTATSTNMMTIALQCCKKSDTPGGLDTCFRWIGSMPDGCVGGRGGVSGDLRKFTYEAAVRECRLLGIAHEGTPYTLCNHDCRNEGCKYNEGPVYTRLPCE